MSDVPIAAQLDRGMEVRPCIPLTRQDLFFGPFQLISGTKTITVSILLP